MSKVLYIFLCISFLICTINLFAPPPYDIVISQIRFLYGNGVGPTSSGNRNAVEYYRSYGQGGTLIEVTAQMNVDGVMSHMYGDVSFTVRCTDGTNTLTFINLVTMLSGRTTAVVQLPYNNATGFTDAFVISGSTTAWTYDVSAVSGNYVGAITSTDTTTIYWDRLTPPQDTDFPPVTESEVAVTLATNSAKIMWNPLTTNSSGGYYNSDFYEYRIRFREYIQDNSNPWRLWNSSNDPTLQWRTYNPPMYPSDDATSHFSAGRKYTTIPNLGLFTRYEFYISAVDVFGNESVAPVTYFQMMTQPYSIEATISDSKVDYSDFTNLIDATLRTVADDNIKVELYIISTDATPDLARIWYTATNDSINLVGDDNAINATAFAEGELSSVVALPSGLNKWIGYLNSDSAAIAAGNTVRFVVETQTGGVSTFSDFDISDLNANDDEWNFFVDSSLNFQSKQVLILNNVITGKHPIAYPSYYLTEDAFVTITVHDVRGRRVATILEGAFRRSGQNIKEKGWRGKNRAGRKLGVGLYYIRFVAKNAKGKTILKEVRKVVVSR